MKVLAWLVILLVRVLAWIVGLTMGFLIAGLFIRDWPYSLYGILLGIGLVLLGLGGVWIYSWAQGIIKPTNTGKECGQP